METTRLTVRVQPRASANGLLGFLEDGTLRMRVTAPPIDGAANDAVCRVLANALGLRRTAVRVTHGKKARMKTVRIAGMSGAEVRERLRN